MENKTDRLDYFTSYVGRKITAEEWEKMTPEEREKALEKKKI